VVQRLVVRQLVPVGRLADDVAAVDGVESDYLAREVFHELHVDYVPPPLLAVFRHLVHRHLSQCAEADVQQFFSVDVHEVAADVHFHDVARAGVVMALAADVLLKSLDAEVCAAALYATVRVVYEGALVQLVGVVVIEMVHYPVAELGGEHLAALGVGDDEAACKNNFTLFLLTNENGEFIFARKKMDIKLSYVYIMTNKTKTVLYIGVTSDLCGRIYEHKKHIFKNSFTDKYNVEDCIYYEMFGDINLAMARETQLKLWRREKKEKLINLVNPNWDIVADEKRIIIELKPKIIMPKR